MGPALSKLQQRTIAPDLLIEPKLGRKPVAPQRVDGDTIDPCVSVPIAKGNNPAATDAADPAEEPLDPSLRFHGFFVSPPNHLLLLASAPSESLAHNTAPAFLNCWYTNASSSITWSL